jgi:hypothetical protein
VAANEVSVERREGSAAASSSSTASTPANSSFATGQRRARVPPYRSRLGGQQRGLGSALVRGALDDARERGLKIVAICPFVEAFVHDHPDDAALAAADPARRPKTRA